MKNTWIIKPKTNKQTNKQATKQVYKSNYIRNTIRLNFFGYFCEKR